MKLSCPMSQSEYNRLYYERHNDRLMKDRHSKWLHDNAYRERGMMRALQQKDKKKRLARRVRGSSAPRLLLRNGKMFFLYPLNFLVSIMGCSYYTVLRWVRAKIVPAHYDSDGGIWLYEDVVQKIKVGMDGRVLNSVEARKVIEGIFRDQKG